MLKRIIREAAIVEAPEFSAINVKQGMTLRYTGGDMEKPDTLKVVAVNSANGALNIIGLDKRGKQHKLGEKDLHAGEYEVMQGDAPPAKKPASWDVTR